jgi:hypothetical protein
MAEAAKPIEIYCGDCGSTFVTRYAWAEWSIETQDWQLGAVYDYAFCHSCETKTRSEEREVTRDAMPVLE